MLAKRGYRVGESAYAEWESGYKKQPSREAIPHLVALWGSEPPPEPEEREGNDLSALVSAISSQTDALNRVADRLEAQSTGDLREAIALAVSQTVQALIQQGLLAVPPARPPRREKQATNG